MEKLKQENFGKRVLQNPQIAIVLFEADWAPPCHRAREKAEEFATKNPYLPIEYFRVDVDQSPAVTERFKVDSVPLFVAFFKGEEIGRLPTAPRESGFFNSLIDPEIQKIH
ncbi:MAG TPA: thioredoxin family protein [Patescibacteria group bacterium]|nr:thioredoxin family protein [Patescibacteria group bacterium]